MAGPIEVFLTADHARLDELLARAVRGDDTIDTEVYAAFRQGLLQHGEIAALLVPSPTPALCAELRAVLSRHNAVEEGLEGLYATGDALAGDEAEQVVERFESQPRVPMAPHYDSPLLNERKS
jgi:hypothetical protein